jgi:hypothetical protein
LGGSEAPVPPLTKEAKDRSDARMGKFISHAQRRAGVVVPTSAEKDAQQKISQPSGQTAETPKEPQKSSDGSGEPTPPQDKPTEPAKQEPVKSSEQEKKDEPKKDSLEYWRAQAAHHQSRADAAEAELKPLREKTKDGEYVAKAELEELRQSKKYVDDFVNDPVGFVMKRMPDLGERLAAAGDPIKLIESEVSAVQRELDKKFIEAYGSEWRFNEVEALKPGTPSFRYKLALEDSIASIRDRQRQYVESQRRSIEEAKNAKGQAREKLKKEFGLTDDDLANADKVLSETPRSEVYYYLAKAVLLDKILENRLKSIPPPTAPSPDLTGTPGAQPPTTEKKPEISETGKRLLHTLGPRAFAK